MKSISIFLSFTISLLLTLHAAESTSAKSFDWVTEKENPALLEKIKQVFALELQPDNPEKVKPIVPYFYKYIARVGLFRSSCLILIGHREKEEDPPDDFFRAFSYDIESGNKSEIRSDIGFWKWTLVTFAYFEPSPTPDIVFKYYDCWECEAVELLSSFRYDEQSRKWVLRIWPDNDPHIMIGSDIQFGAENWAYDCLYKVSDFTEDGFADLAVRCRKIGEQSGVVSDQTLLYTVVKGVPKRIEIRKGAAFNRINKVLCQTNRSSPLCK